MNVHNRKEYTDNLRKNPPRPVGGDRLVGVDYWVGMWFRSWLGVVVVGGARGCWLRGVLVSISSPSFSGVVGAGWPSVRGRVIEGEAVG